MESEYRVVEIPFIEGEKLSSLEIKFVHYNSDGEPENYANWPITSGTLQELRNKYEDISEAFNKPVVMNKDFKFTLRREMIKNLKAIPNLSSYPTLKKLSEEYD